jgi:hypothetical protein
MEEDIEQQSAYIGWIVPVLVIVITLLAFDYAFADEMKIARALVMGKPVFITNKECPLKEHSKTHPWLSYVVEVQTGLSLKGCWKFGTGIKTDLIIIQWDKGDFSELPADLFLQPDSQGHALPVKKIELKQEGDML